MKDSFFICNRFSFYDEFYVIHWRRGSKENMVLPLRKVELLYDGLVFPDSVIIFNYISEFSVKRYNIWINRSDSFLV